MSTNTVQGISTESEVRNITLIIIALVLILNIGGLYFDCEIIQNRRPYIKGTGRWHFFNIHLYSSNMEAVMSLKALS